MRLDSEERYRVNCLKEAMRAFFEREGGLQIFWRNEHFRYGFFVHFLFILPHYHYFFLSSLPSARASLVYFVVH